MEVKQPAGHIDQMLRQTRAHHVQLSQMADSKANMIMTVGSLLVPLSIMDYPDFEDAMEEVMNNHNQTYEIQIREIYIMGRHLERSKYRFVRLSYQSFITGIIFSTFVYMVGLYLF
jgi:hypothetical protein